MQFKIDTERKVLTILSTVEWSELREFMNTFIGPEGKDWRIETQTEFVDVPQPYPVIQEPYRAPFWWDSPVYSTGNPNPPVNTTVWMFEENENKFDDGHQIVVDNIGLKENFGC